MKKRIKKITATQFLKLVSVWRPVDGVHCIVSADVTGDVGSHHVSLNQRFHGMHAENQTFDSNLTDHDIKTKLDILACRFLREHLACVAPIEFRRTCDALGDITCRNIYKIAKKYKIKIRDDDDRFPPLPEYEWNESKGEDAGDE